MKPPSEVDQMLIERIRGGDMDAWNQLIARYEGRLLAFVENRLTNRSASEDIVQETLVGFLNSLPNYDGRRSLESYLFSICAYKLTDYLRREGRRPSIPLSSSSDTSGDWQVVGKSRAASSIARSTERRRLEEDAVLEALELQVKTLAGARRLAQVEMYRVADGSRPAKQNRGGETGHHGATGRQFQIRFFGSAENVDQTPGALARRLPGTV